MSTDHLNSPAREEIKEAIEKLEQASKLFGMHPRPEEVVPSLTEARSRLETLYREQLQEIERLQQDVYRYDTALGRGLTDEERAKTYD